MSKAKIKAAYLTKLAEKYAWARGEMGETAQTRGIAAASEAADKALAGQLKLEGYCWFEALRENGVPATATRAMLRELPA